MNVILKHIDLRESIKNKKLEEPIDYNDVSRIFENCRMITSADLVNMFGGL